MDKIKMGEFLAQLRNSKDLRQQDEADILQVTPQAISKWESGESVPDIGTLERLGDFYHVSIEEIINGERKPVQETPSARPAVKKPTMAERGKGKPYFYAFIFCMAARVLAFVFGFLTYLKLNQGRSPDTGTILFGNVTL